MADVDKAKVIANAYEYANAKAKAEVSNYKLDGWYKKAKMAEDKKIPVAQYLLFKAMLPENPTNAELAQASRKTSLTQAQQNYLVTLYRLPLKK